jgi:outer membrane lipoprotein-sorting protein
MQKICGVGMLGVLMGMGVMAGEASAFSVSYDQKTTMGRRVTNAKVSLKDELFRMDTTAEGQEAVILRNRQGTFMVMPSDGMAMKTTLRPGQGPIRSAANYAQYLKERQAERIGTETVDGYACDIYRFTDPEDGSLVTAWVWKDKMFPVRFEVEGDKGSMLIELSNLQLGATIPDSAFELPAGVQVMDMGALLNMQ